MTSSYTTVELYCDAESHLEKRWVIERFAEMGPADWLPESQLPGGERLRRPEGTRALIDEATSTRIGAEFSPPVKIRDRYNLRCPNCDDTVPVRAENLNPILDVLAAHRVASISLTALRARLGRSETR